MTGPVIFYFPDNLSFLRIRFEIGIGMMRSGVCYRHDTNIPAWYSAELIEGLLVLENGDYQRVNKLGDVVLDSHSTGVQKEYFA